ncbi:MAG TPA: aminotransferase class V-fold PLP-dependent enzyme [Gammaproteobacteria bacterium]|nr:aminotransferase class V-fold PLP-dependent enzyme [Gammaproteobacteria bacterium]
MRLPVYLDYAATTPVDPEVARVMAGCLTSDGIYGNPASVAHAPGRAAREAVEQARAQVAASIGADPGDIVWTSGATEADNLAILGAARHERGRGAHVVTGRVEHKAVLDACAQLEREGFDVTRLLPDTDGRYVPRQIEEALRGDTRLVSIMQVNNETGVVQDIAAIARACRERGVLFHSDAAQSAGRLALDVEALGVDLLSLSAHKVYGPKGVGALYVRRAARRRLEPLLFGGGQELGLRAGTLPTHQIAGMGAAFTLADERLETESLRLVELRDRLWGAVRELGDVTLNGDAAHRVPGILNLSFGGVEGESLLHAMRDLAVSTGSACTTADAGPSYVLRALGRDDTLARSSVRFSFGRFTTREEIDFAARCVRAAVSRLRALSPLRETRAAG